MRRGGLEQAREALTRLPAISRPELLAEWRRLYGAEPPPRLSHDVLIAAIAYRLQEQALGGLRPELRRRLRQIAGEARRGGTIRTAEPRTLKLGTKLLREWQGRTHEVMVLSDGFAWQQTRYRSLSEIARAITGTRWSGPVFFGLKSRSGATNACHSGDADGPH